MKLEHTILCLLYVACLNLASNTNQAIIQNKKAYSISDNSQQNLEEIVSYKSVMKSYYLLAVGTCDSPTKSFDEFVYDYYDRDNLVSIQDYTCQFAIENSTYEHTYSILSGGKYVLDDRSLVSGGGGGVNGNCEDYILKSIGDDFITPQSYFARPPYYNVYDYSNVNVGDILFEATGSVGQYTGHVALIEDLSHQSYYGNYIRTVEAVDPKVHFGMLDDNRMIMFKSSIYRVVGVTYYIATSAKSFVLMQIGKDYDIDHFPAHTSLQSTNWYCSELVYAAYLYSYIDISNGFTTFIIPWNIIFSPNTAPVPNNSQFLDLSINSKSGIVWSIRIETQSQNPPNDAAYNSKMCFQSDAANFSSNLHNILYVNFNLHPYADVSISENWFADYITACYQTSINGTLYKVITYANNLNATNHTLSKKYNFVMIL